MDHGDLVLKTCLLIVANWFGWDVCRDPANAWYGELCEGLPGHT